MEATADLLARHYFNQDRFENLTEKDILDFIEQYPYASWGKIFLALKLKANGGDFQAAASSAAMHMNNPLWLEAMILESGREKNKEKEKEKGKDNGYLKVDAEEGESVGSDLVNGETVASEVMQEMQTHTPVADEPSAEMDDMKTTPKDEFRPIPLPNDTNSKVESNPSMVFEPYHTIDYFASQGIKLNADDLSKDKFGRQLKSFTEWLRSMKKIPPGGQIAVGNAAETAVDPAILQNADASVETSEVDTEAMAEVWAKQGKKARAIEIYEKLSLLNPSKSHYFAAKIEQLNA